MFIVESAVRHDDIYEQNICEFLLLDEKNIYFESLKLIFPGVKFSIHSNQDSIATFTIFYGKGS